MGRQQRPYSAENTARRVVHKTMSNTQALQLWDDWAREQFGYLPSDKINKKDKKEMDRKMQHFKRLEAKCDRLVKRAQQRLEISAQIRSSDKNQYNLAGKSKSQAVQNVRPNQRTKFGDSGRSSSSGQLSASYEHTKWDNQSANESQTSSIENDKNFVNKSNIKQQAHNQKRPMSASAILSSSNEKSSNEECLRSQLQSVLEEVQRRRSTERELRATIDLLRGRLHASSEREVENQRRLQQAQHLNPIFDRLQEKFTFKSPEEILDRLEFLECDKLGTADQVANTQSDNQDLQRQVDDLKQRIVTQAQLLQIEHNEGVSNIQLQLQQKTQEVMSLELTVNRLQQEHDKTIQVYSLIMDLYNKCTENSAAWKGLGEIVLKELSVTQVTHMLGVIDQTLAMHHPTASVNHIMEIARVAHVAWTKYFKDQSDIQGRPKEIFTTLLRLTDKNAGNVRLAKTALASSQAREKQQEQQILKLQVQVRQLQQELNKRNDLIRTVGRRQAQVELIGQQKQRAYSRAASTGGTQSTAAKRLNNKDNQNKNQRRGGQVTDMSALSQQMSGQNIATNQQEAETWASARVNNSKYNLQSFCSPQLQNQLKSSRSIVAQPLDPESAYKKQMATNKNRPWSSNGKGHRNKAMWHQELQDDVEDLSSWDNQINGSFSRGFNRSASQSLHLGQKSARLVQDSKSTMSLNLTGNSSGKGRKLTKKQRQREKELHCMLNQIR